MCDPLFIGGFGVAYAAEAAGNPIVHALGVAGANLEGKECRFGVAGVGAVRDDHHRHVVRRGQLDARLVHAAGRPRAAG